MPLVLTTNEVVLNPDHAWNDIDGVQYHYPNQYKNKIRTGDLFVHYRAESTAKEVSVVMRSTSVAE